MADNPYVNKVVYGTTPIIDLTSTTATEEDVAAGNDMRKLYIQNLIDKYNPRRKDVADMLGLSYGGFVHMCHDLFPSNPFKNEGKGAKPTKEWLDFTSGKLDEPKPVDDFVAAPPDVIIEKKPPVADDAAKNNDPVTLEHLEVRFSGKIAMAFEKVYNMVDTDKDYVISISLFQAKETPTCLPF